MDKYIKVQDLIDRIYPVDPENDGSDGCTVVYQNFTLSSPEIEAILEELPAADVVPVVRCQECKHWGGVDEYGDGYCKNPDGIDNIAKENDFCSYGEKANK